jgi:broad specificity phosphatase PhoE
MRTTGTLYGGIGALALLLGFTTGWPRLCQESAESARAAAPTTLLVVRHADRDGQNDALTAAGRARAQELVHLTAKSGLAAVYCTKTARSRKTAEPVASALGLTPVELDPDDTAGVVSRVLANQRGKTVLAVAHSNTVPGIVAAAGGPTIPDLGEGDFDDLYVVTIGAGSPAEVSVLKLQFGAATP